jgi:hypothetical protein
MDSNLALSKGVKVKTNKANLRYWPVQLWQTFEDYCLLGYDAV